jgi:SprT-like family protein
VLKLPPDEIARMKKMVPTIRELSVIDLMRDYRALRGRHFGKRVPPVEEVAFALVPGRVLSDIFDEGCLGFNVEGASKHVAASVIVIAKESSINETRMTLIHEMAHVSVEGKWNRSMGHGKYWQREMKRLAKSGAFDPWW